MFEKVPCSSIKEIDVDVLGMLRREGKEKIKKRKINENSSDIDKIINNIKMVQNISSLFENKISNNSNTKIIT